MQQFSFVLKYKFGAENKVSNALNCKVSLLTTMSIIITRFNLVKEDYKDDKTFSQIYTDLSTRNITNHTQYALMNGFLSFGNKLCLSNISVKTFFI